MTEYIYLLHPYEFINNNIYKIGKTKQENLKRFNNYLKGSVLLYQTVCVNSDVTEKEILKLFKTKYNLMKGYEYFQGDYNEMINDIYQMNNKNNHEIIKIKITDKNNREGYLLTSDGLWYKFSNNYKDKQLLLWFKNRYNKNYDEFINKVLI